MNPFTWLLLEVLGYYRWIVIASIIMSWLIAYRMINMSSPIVRQIEHFLDILTEPFLGPIRRILPPVAGLDFSPVVLLIAVSFLQQFVVYYLRF